jgi:hypothetical protein
MDAQSLDTAQLEEKDKIMEIRKDFNQRVFESGPKSIMEVQYDLIINQTELSEVLR